MSHRNRLKHVEQQLRKGLKSFELVDGSRYYYDPNSAELFLHFTDCLRAHDKAERPEPPPRLKAMARAKNKKAVLEQAYGDEEAGSLMSFPYEREAFIERGELIPRSLVVGYELGEPLPDLSE